MNVQRCATMAMSARPRSRVHVVHGPLCFDWFMMPFPAPIMSPHRAPCQPCIPCCRLCCGAGVVVAFLQRGTLPLDALSVIAHHDAGGQGEPQWSRKEYHGAGMCCVSWVRLGGGLGFRVPPCCGLALFYRGKKKKKRWWGLLLLSQLPCLGLCWVALSPSSCTPPLPGMHHFPNAALDESGGDPRPLLSCV